MLTAGSAKITISPAAGAPLAGYAAREHVSTGVHDDLYARALVIDNGQRAIALVGLDLLAVPASFVQRVRRAITARTGIAAEAILVSSTHTHAAPVTIATFFNPGASLDQTYLDRLARAIELAVVTAWQQRQPARVGLGSGSVEGVGVNRRSTDLRPVDPEVGILRVDDPEGRPRAMVVNYACHPTVLGPDNLLASADFPGYTVSHLENALGDDSFAMFVNGAQGDISMGHSSELSAIGIITPGRTFARAEALGVKLANAALAMVPRLKTSDTIALDARLAPLDLAWKSLPAPAVSGQALTDAEARLQRLVAAKAPADEIARARTARLYASIENFYAGEHAAANGGPLRIELQGLRLGDTMIGAVPAEVFVEVGLAWKQRAHHRAYFAGVTNGYIAYLPTDAAYEAGGYEVVSAKCARGSAGRLVDGLLRLERELFPA